MSHGGPLIVHKHLYPMHWSPSTLDNPMAIPTRHLSWKSEIHNLSRSSWAYEIGCYRGGRLSMFSFLSCTTAMQPGLPTAGMSKSPLEIISLHSHLPEQGQTIPRASLNTKLPSLVLVIQKLTTTSPKGQMSTTSIPPIFTPPKPPPSSPLLCPPHFGLIWRPFAQSSSRPADRK